MRIIFLGTSGAVPTTERNVSALLLARAGDRFLFDCGEGTQRQMMRFNTGFDVAHVFITHTHGDHVLGLPGLVETWAFNERDTPLAIHAPAGTRSKIENLLGATGHRPSFPVRVTQVEPGDVVLDREEYTIRAVGVDHGTTAVGYRLDEDDRKGRFDREKAEDDLGIPPGPKYSRLHRGEPVDHEGQTIEPEAVVGPPRPGRRVVYTGDTTPTETVIEAASGADLLVHDATFADDHVDRAGQTDHSTARQAARVASKAGAERLALTHLSTRYAGRADRLEKQAATAFDGRVVVPDDGTCLTVPYPDAEESMACQQR